MEIGVPQLHGKDLIMRPMWGKCGGQRFTICLGSHQCAKCHGSKQRKARRFHSLAPFVECPDSFRSQVAWWKDDLSDFRCEILISWTARTSLCCALLEKQGCHHLRSNGTLLEDRHHIRADDTVQYSEIFVIMIYDTSTVYYCHSLYSKNIYIYILYYIILYMIW